MKNWPMAVKIWAVFAAVLLCLFIAVSSVLPTMLRDFFTGQIYGMIEDSQQPFENSTFDPDNGILLTKTEDNGSASIVAAVPRVPTEDSSSPNAAPTSPGRSTTNVAATRITGPDIRHLYYKDRSIYLLFSTTAELPQSMYNQISQQTLAQKETVATYEGKVAGQTLFYIINKSNGNSEESLISYTWGSYRNEQAGALFKNLIWLLIALMLLCWLPCLWLSRYLSKPINEMEKQMTRISERDWHEPFELERRDEIGRLAKAFETMRQRLVQQDQAQQSYLQHTSHELKTPVMVIHSYAHSIKEGIYPKGSLESSIETIISESDRLDEQIHSLLRLNRLQYVTSTTRKSEMKPLEIKEVLEDVVQRLRYKRANLEWTVDLPAWTIQGSREQWKVVFENIIDNAIRYASKEIRITAEKGSGPRSMTVEIYNDGPQVEESMLTNMFNTFRTGPYGKFGLGLAIVKQILNSIGAQIEVVNKQTGVAFRIALPEEEPSDGKN
ncbi:two-component system, OmpR family, sensor histidine kinase CssS [Paenibacillaceae bacterium GAS479]|nr:two-component system, OmpR family, sensor histidine kinase CssS [Paenibacillaceae bacterium GAS479]